MTEQQRRKRKPPKDVTTWMREDWDERAREDARYYINDKEHKGFDFALSGCRDVWQTLGPVHEELRHDMKVLEIGCGMGRMLQFLAVLFAEVHGTDIAPAMVEQARRYLAKSQNVLIHQGDGQSLTGLQDGYFDFILSFQVFQHIPDKAVVSSYVREMFRVLKDGGLARFLVKTKPWEGQGKHDTWCGVELTKEDLDGWCKQDPWLMRSAADSDDPTKAWVLLQKPK